MAIGSVAMWVGVPLGLVYVVSKLSESTRPSLGPYLIILFGLPVGMTVIGKGLGALDRFYGRRTSAPRERRRAAWLKPMSGERRDAAGGWNVLDAVMIWSVGTALLCFGIWLLLFAGSSIG